MAVRIGIDTGGTFTDLVALDEVSGAIRIVKRPSTPHDPSAAILDALAHLDVSLADVGYFVLGTTVALNALLQRHGARVIYVATEGFQDIPFLQRVDRKFHYDLDWERPLPLVRRRDCLGVVERCDYRGEVIEALTPAALATLRESVGAALAGTDGQNVAIAVNLLFSYVHPDHERRVGEFLAREFPGVPISLSHEVAPIWREYDRASTTIADAYVRPLMGHFAQALDAGLRGRGLARPWAIMKSNGGQMIASAAAERPVHAVLSGLSGGMIAGKFFGEMVDDPNVISFDMGGTSTDVGVIVDSRIGYSTAWEIEFGLPVAAPFIELTTMGAGGGSIAWINKGGLLQVGPQSAGADPGPACYGRGGRDATVTDANLALGRLNPENFLGGEIRLDVTSARAAVETVGRRIGLDVEAAACAIIDVANENMAEATRQLTVGRGLDPRQFSLVAFGGAGPLHGPAVAWAVGARRVIVPSHPGLGSAFGTLLADMRVDKTWTHILRSDALHAASIDARLRELVAHAVADLRGEGFTGEPHVLRSANMRYLGQNYEEEIPIPAGDISDAGLRQLLMSFEDYYERSYGYRITGEIIEIVQFNVTVVGVTRKPTLPPVPARSPALPRAHRPVWFEPGGFVDCPIFYREDLSPTGVLAGPAVIEELDSTTIVQPGHRFTVTSLGLGVVEWT